MMSSPLPARKKGKGSSSQNIKVFLRCRPMNAMEKASKSYNIVGIQNSREVVVKERPTDKFAKTFAFDHVFGPDSKQIDVYKAVAKNSVEEVLNGFNCTIFAYGQTGTGKTFTMEGERATNTTTWEEDPLAGIIPRCVNHLFDELRMQKLEFTMRVSFLELYNEEVFDLLSAHDDMSKLRLYEDSSKKGSCIIQGLEEVLVRSKSDVYNILEKGSTKRQTAATLMNAHSSRSHTVFTVTVHMKENTLDGDELLKTGKLHLVDLAGSENIGRSGAVEKRAREAGNINMSLLTLGRVITSLVEKAPHIPYRESKLTRLLQDALGGRTKTSVVATISPAHVNQEETLSTLDYAHRAKNIQNKPEVNQKLNKKELIGEYSQEIERLRRDLMAMREKNGVYLANENYEEIMATMEAQAEEITEKIGHIRTLEAVLEKKTELFTEVTKQLETTSQELTNTQEKLSSTRTTLSCTQRLLHTTVQEREEQRYLVEAHAKTEEKLHSEGQSLINVATSTSSDLARLHDKLDRKRNVESKNAEVFQSFQDSYTDFQDTLRQDLMPTVAKHTEAFTTASSKHCESVRQCRSVVANMSGALTTLGEKQAALTNTALALVKKMVKVLLEGVKEAREEARTDSTHQREVLHDLLATETKTLDQLATLISATSTSIASLHSALNDKLQHMEAGCDGLQQHFSSFTTQLLEEVATHHSALLHHTDDCTATLTTHLASTQTRAQSFTTNLESMLTILTTMKEEMAEFTASSQEQVSATQHKLSVLKEEAQQGADRVTAITQQGRDRGTSLLSETRTQTLEARTHVDERVSELEGTMQRLGEKRCEIETALQHYVGKIQQSLDTTTASQDCHVNSLEEGAAEHLKSVQEEMETGQNSMKEALAGHSHSLQQEAEGLDRGQKQLAEELEGVEAGLKEWGMELDNRLQTQASRVMALFTQEMMEDRPTGQTPVRREYTFPNSLPATSPYERLLQRFRVSAPTSLYHSRIPLPSLGDDTEDDLGESTLSASSSDSTHTNVNDDDPLTEDSLSSNRSRSGSVSSLKDQGSAQFAVPRPPLQRENSGIPLSRSSSSSSITEGKENYRGTKQSNSSSSTTTKKRELKQPSVYKSTSLEKLPANTTASEGRTRRILSTQN